MLEVETRNYPVFGMWRRMHLPTQPQIERESAVYAEVVLEIKVDLLLAEASERRVQDLAVGTRRAEKKVRVRESRVWHSAIVSSRFRIVQRGRLVGECDSVGGPVRKIAETFMTVAAAERKLMVPPDLRHVFVDSRQDLAHAVIKLRTTIRHDQISSDGREASLSEVIGQAQQPFIVLIDIAAAFNVHPLPLLANNRFRKEG